MAQIDDGGGGGRRSAIVDVNIVPFIDLMSVLIIFLLITAVWTQVSMIQIGSSVYGKKTALEETPPPKAQIPFRLDVTDKGYRIVLGRRTTEVPMRGESYNDEMLVEQLKKIKELYPEKVDAVITVLDELPYNC